MRSHHCSLGASRDKPGKGFSRIKKAGMTPWIYSQGFLCGAVDLWPIPNPNFPWDFQDFGVGISAAFGIWAWSRSSGGKSSRVLFLIFYSSRFLLDEELEISRKNAPWHAGNAQEKLLKGNPKYPVRNSSWNFPTSPDFLGGMKGKVWAFPVRPRPFPEASIKSWALLVFAELSPGIC